MTNLRIALVQLNPTVGDLAGNTRKILSYIKKAKDQKADIVVFPELSITGYPPEDLLLKPHFIKENKKFLQKVKNHTHNITAIIGFVDTKKNNVYNSAAIFHNKKHIYTYNKLYLPNYGVFDEKRYFSPGNECVIFELNNIKWSVTICEDIWVKPCKLLDQIKKAKSQIIFNISASPYHRGKLLERKSILKKQATVYKSTIAYCNMVGGQDELVFDGGNLIINSNKKVLAQGNQFQEDIVLADIKTKTTSKKKTKTTKSLRYIKLKTNISKATSSIKQPKITTLSVEEEIYSALVLGVKDYVRKNGFKKVILGLSGGIDSSLTALIAADSIGGNNVIAISMPSEYTSKGTFNDTKKLAKNLGIKLISIPITKVFHTYLSIFKKHFHNLKWDTTEENIQARIRGNLLMAFSNKFGYLVLTTGNKSETSVGYCTLYGDMAGGFAVLKDVPKEMVYKLSRYRNKKEKWDIIPKSIIKRAPSAELRKKQKDQDSLPPYPVLDTIIDLYIEKNNSLKEIIKSGISKKTTKKIINLIDTNEYKRRQAPPGIKITPKAFGKDRRIPITNKALY